MVTAEKIKSARRKLQIATGLAVAIVVSVIISGLYADDLVEITLQEDYSVSVDGSDVVFDGNVYIGNPFYWEMSDVTVSLWVEDNSNGKEYKIWDSPRFDVPARGGSTVPVHARFGLIPFCASIINSVATEDSFVSFRTVVNAGIMFDLLDVEAEAHAGIQLAEDGKILTYETVTNTANAYSIRISGLKESLKPEDFDAVLTSAGGEVSVSSRDYDGYWIFEMNSPGNLDENINHLNSEEEASEGLPDGIDGQSMAKVLYLLTYARWFI